MSEPQKLRVLVACEFSGTVRDAFIRAGHEALSCDLLPSESDFGPHYQGDVFDVSVFFRGIADAMAAQWGGVVEADEAVA